MNVISIGTEAGPSTGLRLSLLGGFRVESNGVVLSSAAWRRRSASALVKLLAIEPSHRLHREQVQDTVWPDLAPDAAAASFRQALHVARRALHSAVSAEWPSPVLSLQGDLVVLGGDAVWIDIDHFRALTAEALGPAGSAAELERALAAYGGELLPEDRYEDWAIGPREALARLHSQVLERLADVLEAEGPDGEAITRLEELLAIDPMREELHRRLMALQARSGNRSAALRQYETCREILAQTLGIEPEPDTEAAYRRILTGTAAGASAGVSRRPHHESNRAAASDAVPILQPAMPAALHRAPEPPLVGREEALRLLTDALRGPDQGTQDAEHRPQNSEIILVSGEPGIGKTRIVSEAARVGVRRGMAVLWGACFDGEGHSPYGPLVEALARFLAGLDEAHHDELLARHPECAEMLPGLSRDERSHLSPAHVPSDTGIMDTDGRRLRTYATIASFLADLVRDRPVVLVLDDLQWADHATLQLLHYLVRDAHATDCRVRVLATLRFGGVPPDSELQRMLAVLTRSRRVRRVTLLRLARAESDRLVRSYLGGDVDGAALDCLAELALGNPLYLEELVETLRDDGALVHADGRWRLRQNYDVTVPATIREIIEARVDHLGEPASRILALAAVIGMEFTFDLLAAAARDAFHPPPAAPEIVDALDAALTAHIIEERAAAAGTYSFHHPLSRMTLHDRLSQQRRALLHVAVGRALEELDSENLDALAYHYREGHDRERAVSYLERAGDRARALYAHDDAVRYYRAALDTLAALGRADESADIGAKLGAALADLARYDEALAALEASAALDEASGNDDRFAYTVAIIGRVHMMRGTHEEGIARVRPVHARLEGHAHAGAIAALSVALALLWRLAGRYEDQLATARRAAELAAVAGDERLHAEAELWAGYALLALGRSDDGVRALHGVIPLAQSLDDLGTLARALNGIAAVLSDRGELEAERRYLMRAIAATERLGDPSRTAFMHFRVAENALLTGDWTEARSRLQQAEEMAEWIGTSWITPYILCALGALALFRGEPETAGDYLARCIRYTQERNEVQVLPQAQMLLADLDIMQGRAEAARARLAPLLARHDLEEVHRTYILPTAAWAELELGKLDDALCLAEQAVERARSEHVVYTLVHALRVLGMVWTQQERWDDAEQAVEEAVRLARAMPYPLAEGRALQAWGMLHTARHEPEAARRRLDESIAIFERLGAQMDRDVSMRLLVQRSTFNVQRPAPTTRPPGTLWVDPGDVLPVQTPAMPAARLPASDLTDRQWARVEGLFPKRAGAGRRRAGDRDLLNGILWVLRAGARWSDMPRRYGAPATAHRRYQEWVRTGLWEQIEAALG